MSHYTRLRPLFEQTSRQTIQRVVLPSRLGEIAYGQPTPLKQEVDTKARDMRFRSIESYNAEILWQRVSFAGSEKPYVRQS